MDNLDIRAFNEVRELKKDFTDTFIRKRFRDKVKTFHFQGDGSASPIKVIEFEGLAGSIFNLRVEASVASSQNFYIKFNSLTIYKNKPMENFELDINLELEKNNTLEFFSDGEIFVKAILKGNIDIQDLDNIEIVEVAQTYYVSRRFGDKTYFNRYSIFETLADEFELVGGSIKENFVTFSKLINNVNGLVYNYTLAVLTGNPEQGFVMTHSNDGFVLEHTVEYDYSNGVLLPIISSFYNFGIVAFENNSFFINYYDAEYQKIKELLVSFDLKYPVKSVSNIDYFNDTEFNHHGFAFVDKNNDAYLVLVKDSSVEDLEFHNSPVYLGKATNVKIYSKGNKFIVYLSYDNAVTKIVLNITHDSLSLNANRMSKTSVKNVSFGFLDGEEDYYYSNGYITKLT